MLSEVRQGIYDLVVTDLDYDIFGGISGGERVIDALQGKHTLALCTTFSIDPDSDLGRRVDILASRTTGVYLMDKFELLGLKISLFYKKK